MRSQPSAEPGHHDVTFNWTETDPNSPARDVLVRLVALTDFAQDQGDLRPYLMSADGDGLWTLTLRLPSTLRSSYQICPIRDRPMRGHPSEDRWMEILAMGVCDPTNPAMLGAGSTYGNPGPASILDLPGSLPQPWHGRRPESPRGTMTPHQIETDGRESATVHVYLPHGYEALVEPAALLVVFDARFWVANGIADMFDNLIAAGALRPMVVVAVESNQGATRLSGLTHPDIFEPFLVDELLPWVAARWKITTDPAETVVAGQSLGGLTAAYIARLHPDRFGWVIGQSAAAWWPGDNVGGLSGRQVVDAYAGGDHVPVRFFLEVGSRESELLQSVRDMHDVLLKRGYDVRYREYEGGHDVACWRGGLADGLIAALGTRSG